MIFAAGIELLIFSLLLVRIGKEPYYLFVDPINVSGGTHVQFGRRIERND